MPTRLPVHGRLRATACLAALVTLSACGDAIAPAAPAAPDLTIASTYYGAVAPGGDRDRTDVHAVNVRITSQVFESVVVDRYSFHVHGEPGEMKGNFKLYQMRMVAGQEEAVVIARGDMICASVAGMKARVGGRVTWSSFPAGIPAGSELTWSVTELGSRRAPDTASQPLGNQAEAYCALGLPYPEQAVERGQVRVKGG